MIITNPYQLKKVLIVTINCILAEVIKTEIWILICIQIKLDVIPLIDEKKITDQKIQLDIAINLRHITKNDRITFYIKSKNIVFLPSDNSEDILEQLINSLLKYYADKLLICRRESSYVYESVEGLSIDFHKIDLIEEVHIYLLLIV